METVSLCASHFVCDCGVVVVAIFLPSACFAIVRRREVTPARVAVRIAFRVAALAPLSVRQVIIVGIPLPCGFLSIAAFLLFDWLMCSLCCHNSLKHGCYLAHVVTDCCRWCDDRWYLCTVCMVDDFLVLLGEHGAPQLWPVVAVEHVPGCPSLRAPCRPVFGPRLRCLCP